MFRLRIIVVSLAAALLMTASVACNDDGDGQEDLPPDIVFTPLPEETPPQTVTVFEPDADLSGLEGDAAELARLLDEGLSVTFRARYSTRSGQTEGDDFVIYHDPPLTRIDLIPPGGSTPSSILLSRTEGRAVECIPSEEGEFDCEQFDPLGGPPLASIGPVIFPAVSDLEEGEVRRIEDTTIAGEQASCYEVDLAGDQHLEYCLSNDGIVLSSVAGSLVVQAEEFSRSVSEDAFLLPER